MNEDEPQANTSCSMTGLLGIVIQVGLGIMSFSVLFIKRFRQKPQRPWKIWIFDTSKQLISQLIAHFINLTISIALTYDDQQSDECLWYFMTNILDNTFGVLICILCLKGIEWSLIRRNKIEYISGNYYKKEKATVLIEIMDFHKGEIKDNIQVQIIDVDQKNRQLKIHKDQMNEEVMEDVVVQKQKEFQFKDTESQQPHNNSGSTQNIEKYKINYQAWLVQLLIWVSVVVIGKILLFILEYGIRDPLKKFSFLILGWIQNYPVLQLFVVIVFVPVIMNGLAFWVQDNFLMKRQQNWIQNESALVQQVTTNRQENLIIQYFKFYSLNKIAQIIQFASKPQLCIPSTS